MSKFLLSAAAVAALLPVAALAHPPTEPILAVAHAYARSTNPAVAAAFMTLYNKTAQDCVLTGVTAEGFARAELHTHRDEGGVMKMVQLDKIDLPAGASHELERGGDHVMLMEPEAKIAQGQKVSGVLDFGSCGTVPFTATVDNEAGSETKAPGAAHTGHAAHGEQGDKDEHASH